MSILRIEELARRMRFAIESLSREKLPISMSEFPAGACGDVCLLLGAYFKDRGVSGFEYIAGERGNQRDSTWTSHAWLARESLIVDITADQFEDAPGKIIVSGNSAWHRTFKAERAQPSNFREWSGPGTYHLYKIYSLLHETLFSEG